MASPTRFMEDFVLPFAKGFDKTMLDSNNPINAIKAGLAQRFFSQPGRANSDLIKAVGGKMTKGGRKLEFNYKGKKKGDLTDDAVHLSNWQLAKSAFYNKEGRLQQSRVAGAAVGFGGGAIAGLNLAGDMIFDD